MRRVLIPLVVGASLVVFGIWIARNTYWTDVQIPSMPKGEARTNSFYAVQRFAEALGARTAWDRVFTIPAPNSIIVLSTWNWGLSDVRRVALEHWVESGGRLIVEGELMGDDAEFEQWSGIIREPRKEDETRKPAQTEWHPCHSFREDRTGASVESSDSKQHWICGFDEFSNLTTSRTAAWSLRSDVGIHAMRVHMGRGSVTVINGSPFQDMNLFDGDHGWLFVAASELQRGDDVHFVSEEKQLSLLALLWLYGRPAVLLALVLVGCALWRGSVRLGPLAPTRPSARRSLAEQIRGSGRFALRHGGGEALHAACTRALDESADRRVSGYRQLSARERAAAVAALTGFDRNGLAAAIHHPGLRQSHELRTTIEMIETARRTVMARGESRHGTA
jgi:hypothetical protein